MSGFEPASPYPAPPPQPTFTAPSQPLTDGYLGSEAPYTLSETTAPAPKAVAADRRPVSYYIFLALSALALFAVSMFVTILLLGT